MVIDLKVCDRVKMIHYMIFMALMCINFALFSPNCIVYMHRNSMPGPVSLNTDAP